MQLVILNNKNQFRQKDIERLEKYNPVFYEKEANKLEEINELYNGEDVVLGVKPTYIEGAWKGLPYEKVSKIKNLKGIALSTTAFGWAPYKELAEHNIPVTNVPGKSTIAVAEYYLYIMIALLRKLPIIELSESDEENKTPLGRNAAGLKAGIIGLGSIGSRIAELTSAMGMEICYWNRSPKSNNYESVSLEELFKKSDVVFVTVAADKETAGLITREHIDLMKKDAVFLSAVEHEVYDYDYIVQKVQNNELGGFGYEGEEKFDSGNIFAAEEVAYYTKQTMEVESELMTDSLISIIEGHPVNRVN